MSRPALSLVLVALLLCLPPVLPLHKESPKQHPTMKGQALSLLQRPAHHDPYYGFCERHVMNPGHLVNLTNASTGLNYSAVVLPSSPNWAGGASWVPWEPANTISGLIQVIFGVLGLFGSPESSMMMNFMWSVLILNGVGSVWFHWTLSMSGGYFDTFPMGLLVLMGFLIIYSQVHLHIIDRSDKEERWTYRMGTKFMGFVVALCLVVYLGGQALSIANVQDEGESAGLLATFLFVFVLLLTGVISAVLSCKSYKYKMWANFAPKGTVVFAQIDNGHGGVRDGEFLPMESAPIPPEFLLAFSLGRRACAVGLVGMVFWLTAELACGAETKNMHRGKSGQACVGACLQPGHMHTPTPGRFVAWMHVVWHLLIGYTSYLLLALAQWLQGISLSRYNIEVAPWFTFSGRCKKKSVSVARSTSDAPVEDPISPCASRTCLSASGGCLGSRVLDKKIYIADMNADEKIYHMKQASKRGKLGQIAKVVTGGGGDHELDYSLIGWSAWLLPRIKWEIASRSPHKRKSITVKNGAGAGMVMECVESKSASGGVDVINVLHNAQQKRKGGANGTTIEMQTIAVSPSQTMVFEVEGETGGTEVDYDEGETVAGTGGGSMGSILGSSAVVGGGKHWGNHLL